MGVNRFDNNDESFDFEDETFEDYLVNPEEMLIPAEMTKFRQEELTVSGHKVNASILKQAVEISQKSWFWRFRSTASKLKSLTQMYFALSDLIHTED